MSYVLEVSLTFLVPPVLPPFFSMGLSKALSNVWLWDSALASIYHVLDEVAVVSLMTVTLGAGPRTLCRQDKQ